MITYLIGVLIMFIIYRVARFFDEGKMDWETLAVCYFLILASWGGILFLIAGLIVWGGIQIKEFITKKDPPKWL